MVAGASIFVGLLGGAYLNSQGTVRTESNMTYQGYHKNKADGNDLLIFDDAPLPYRTGNPDLRVIGNPNKLEIGTEYDIEVKSPRWVGLDSVYSIKQRD